MDLNSLWGRDSVFEKPACFFVIPLTFMEIIGVKLLSRFVETHLTRTCTDGALLCLKCDAF